MQIIDKVVGVVRFSTLSNGQVFKGEFGGIYLKITSSVVYDNNDNLRYNAFDLEGRYLVFINEDIKVIPVETTLTITSFKET